MQTRGNFLNKDVYGEASLSPKIFTDRLNMGLPLRTKIKQLSCKEKVPGAAVSKEGHADSVLEHKKTQL